VLFAEAGIELDHLRHLPGADSGALAEVSSPTGGAAPGAIRRPEPGCRPAVGPVWSGLRV